MQDKPAQMKRLGWLWGHFSTGWWRTIFLYLPDKHPSQTRANKNCQTRPERCVGSVYVSSDMLCHNWRTEDVVFPAAGERQPNGVLHDLSGFYQVTNNKWQCIKWPMPSQNDFFSYASLYGQDTRRYATLRLKVYLSNFIISWLYKCP